MKSMMVCIATAGTMDEDFEPLSCLIACSGYSRCLQESCCQFGATTIMSLAWIAAARRRSSYDGEVSGE